MIIIFVFLGAFLAFQYAFLAVDFFLGGIKRKIDLLIRAVPFSPIYFLIRQTGQAAQQRFKELK